MDGVAREVGVEVALGQAVGQAWPSKPITMIVPFAAGGPTDLLARIIGERIRSTVADTPVEYNGRSIRITVSAGFAVADVGVPADYSTMLETAAAALSVAKQSGRNRCEVRRLPAAQAG